MKKEMPSNRFGWSCRYIQLFRENSNNAGYRKKYVFSPKALIPIAKSLNDPERTTFRIFGNPNHNHQMFTCL